MVSKKRKVKQGFTIVELLVVITIIGILAAITTVAYSGITQKATIASLQSDLSNNSKLLKLYYAEYGYYPSTLDANNCPATPTTDSKYCLKTSNGNTLSYQPSSASNASQYSLYVNKNTTYYRISSDTGLTTAAVSKVCPYGFIVVPGSSTYSTSDFCVMKYEAKADDNSDGVGDTNQTTGYNTWPADTHPISDTRKLVSTAAGYSVTNISQDTAKNTAAPSYTANCPSGCHLITEAEWMTIAQNVLSVASNWSGGSVDSGYIYSGHNDSVPAKAIEADSNDVNGYANTGNTSGNQRRTLTLTNSEVIWDLAGNIWEWTQGTIAGNQQPGLSGESAYAWKEWNNGSLLMNGLPALSRPSSTGISGISGWDSSKGIGRLFSNYGETGVRAFRRGGIWGNGSTAGVLALYLYDSSSDANYYVGLRVSR
jgi:prepilin-type N-terminal cleavage/methylation domain-containing protein